MQKASKSDLPPAAIDEHVSPLFPSRDIQSRSFDSGCSISDLSLSPSRSESNLMDDRDVKFDLSGFENEEDYDEDVNNVDEFDLNQTCSSKTMSQRKLSLMLAALEESEGQCDQKPDITVNEEKIKVFEDLQTVASPHTPYNYTTLIPERSFRLMHNTYNDNHVNRVISTDSQQSKPVVLNFNALTICNE